MQFIMIKTRNLLSFSLVETETTGRRSLEETSISILYLTEQISKIWNIMQTALPF